ncbi:MAG: hypothetical protein L0Z50_18035 [Verrucomicrobiales bacterium]|nr:hypothetical protein [Verrucomicrobiales bacterium]
MRRPGLPQGQHQIQRALVRSQAFRWRHAERVFKERHVHSRFVGSLPGWAGIRRTDVTSIELLDQCRVR